MDDGGFLERPCIEVAYGDPKKPILLRVVPLKVRQIPAFQKYFYLAISALTENNESKENAGPIVLDIAELITRDRINLIKAVAMATDKTEEFISSGVLLTQFIPLIEAVFQVNHDFIFAKGDAPQSGKPRKAQKWGWADCIQHLISNGHAYSDVMEYTYAEMKAYSEASSRMQRLALANNLLNLRVAQFEQEDFNKFFEELTNG